ncbi:hypothetical protein [Mesorhizobium sp. BE184]|uniref:hypothetical protein n=1 Tax=Mesorhizobium sp. BE184 TaxID=2817714 RepID=UPI0028654CCD|nr:hypothetical protein [Mesorhizobium sp. BE184]MDR7034512.1 hypothetical protein [Mesorhizobium sp. BE184]
MTRQFTHEAMAEEIGKLVWSKRAWLEQFGSGKAGRPQHEIETKQIELAVLEQAHGDYRNAAGRKKASA